MAAATDERGEAQGFEVAAADAGRRLDRIAARRFGVPVAVVQRWLRTGALRVDGQRAALDHRVCGGEQVRLRAGAGRVRWGRRSRRRRREPPALDAAERRAIARRVRYRDEALVVYDKPAGQVVHAGSGHACGLVDVLAAWLAAEGLEARPVPVHRLDRATSGLVVFAIEERALRALHEAFRQRRVRKQYVAWCVGRLVPACGQIAAALCRPRGRDGRSRVVRPGAPGAQHALTRYRLEASGRVAGCEIARVALEPLTGRRHQLRVHLAHAGAPIVGDARYGDRAANARIAAACGVERLALHAWRLAFRHPLSGRPLRFEAPLPRALVRLCERGDAPRARRRRRR